MFVHRSNSINHLKLPGVEANRHENTKQSGCTGKNIDLVLDIYLITRSFPKIEMYGLCSQLRRAAVSIPSNIAEGAARKNRKEFTQFLYIALGSITELETQLIIAANLKYFQYTPILSKLGRSDNK